MHEWNDLFVATAGSAAALAGLLFVGVSINLSKILIPESTLAERAMIALILLITILLLSIVNLIPAQPVYAKGAENLLIVIIVWLFVFRMDYNNWKKTLPEYKRYYFFSILLNQLSTLPYIVAAVFMFTNSLSAYYFLVFGFIASFIKSISDAWVLLVEINR